MATATPPNSQGRRQSSSPHRPKRAERCSPEWTHLSGSASTLSPSLPSTAGSRVKVARRTKKTDSMMPAAIDWNAGAGTSMTVESAMSTVRPEKSTALPAVSIVSPTDSPTWRCRPKCAPRKRTTMKRA